MRKLLLSLACMFFMAGLVIAGEVTLVKFDKDKKEVTVKEGDAEKTYKITDKTKFATVDIINDGGTINGGYFVLSPRVLDLIDGDDSSWEGSPIVRLAAMGQMMAFEHRGFWLPMDTLRDKQLLEKLWDSGQAPWKVEDQDDVGAQVLRRETSAGDGTDRVQRRLAG